MNLAAVLARRRSNILVVLFMVAVMVLVLLPLYRLQELALEDGGAGYQSILDAPWLSEVLRTTVALAVGSVAIAVVLGVALAYAATRLPARLSFLRAAPVLPIVIPAVAFVIGWTFLLSPRPGYLNVMLRKLPWWSHLDQGPVDVYTLPWIVIITGIGLTSFVYLFVSSGLQNLNPELLEASRLSGAPPVRTFLSVTFPLLRPVIVYGSAVALLLGLGQFTTPLLLGRNEGIDVITTRMYNSIWGSPVDYPTAAALGSPLLIFGVLIVVAQKVMIGDQSRFVTQTGKASRIAADRSSPLAAALILGYGLVTTVLPVAALLIVALSPYWRADIVWSDMGLDAFRTVFEGPDTLAAIRTSLVSAIGAVAIAIPVGYIATAILMKRRRHRVAAAVIDAVVSMPLGVPAVIFGIGFLLAYIEPPIVLYGSRWVIVLVYLTLMLPFATRMLLSARMALGEAFEEASRVSGTGVVGTNVRILVPMLRPTLAGAGALMFVLLSHEFSASMLVRAPSTQVMGTILYDFWNNGTYPVVAAIAIVMTVITAVGVVVAILFGGRDVLDKL